MFSELLDMIACQMKGGSDRPDQEVLVPPLRVDGAGACKARHGVAVARPHPGGSWQRPRTAAGLQ